MAKYLEILNALNSLGKVDRAFFLVCAAIIVAVVVVYFLIPVFNRKQYQEQRENLKKREDAFKSNRNSTKNSEAVSADKGDVVDGEANKS